MPLHSIPLARLCRLTKFCLIWGGVFFHFLPDALSTWLPWHWEGEEFFKACLFCFFSCEKEMKIYYPFSLSRVLPQKNLLQSKFQLLLQQVCSKLSAFSITKVHAVQGFPDCSGSFLGIFKMSLDTIKGISQQGECKLGTLRQM